MRALWGLWAHRLYSGEYRSALALAQRFSDLALNGANPADVPIADRMLGLPLHYLGDQRAARGHLERMLARYVAHRSHRVRFVYDQQVIARGVLARILWLQRWPEQAVNAAQRAVEDALGLEHPPSLCWALAEGACPVALYTGDLTALERSLALLLDHATRHALSL